MMKVAKFALMFAAVTLAASCSYPANAATRSAVNKDFGKLSVDGSKAILDVRAARIAIFNGHPDEAKKYIDEAKSAIDKSKTDDAVFTQAETDLKAPSGVSQPNPANIQPSTTPIKWIPVDASMTLNEDYSASPEKTASVAKANEQLKKGQHKEAVETLKLADIDLTLVMEVAPLDKTIQGIDNADQLITSGKYYEANQALKGVEDGLRFDVVDATAVPDKDSKKGSAPTPDANPTPTGK